MSNAIIFDGNPNPKVLTFEINTDLLGSFSKLVIPKNGALLDYCPIAESLFQGDVTRVDIAARDSKTYVTISRKLMEWTDDQRKAVTNHLNLFLSQSTPAAYLDAITQNITSQPPFKPNNSIQKMVQASFNDQVNPLLASDGGAMELMNVSLKSNGDIEAEVALIGSCNGCSSAETETLAKATEKIKSVLNAAKIQNSGNATLQKLNFKEIQIREIPELAIRRN